jgi:hypothetical protein
VARGVPVYNIAVEEDESYIAEGVVTHNCGPLEGTVWALDEVGEKMGYPAASGIRMPVHPNCVVGDTRIRGAGQIHGTSRRWYAGDMIRLTTEDGREVRCTPNHPLLTPAGWQAAGSLRRGAVVLRYVGILAPRVTGYRGQEVATIAALVEWAEAAGARPQPVGTNDFHGDGRGSQAATITGTPGVAPTEPDGPPPECMRAAIVHSVTAYAFEGYVYNLDTEVGWYAANGLASKNCRHTWLPHILPDPEKDRIAPEWVKDPREAYRQFKAAHPDRLRLARQGFVSPNQVKSWARANPGVDEKDLRGPSFRYAGIEGRRIAATKEMLLNPGLTYGEAMSAQTREFMALGDYGVQRPPVTPSAQRRAYYQGGDGNAPPPLPPPSAPPPPTAPTPGEPPPPPPILTVTKAYADSAIEAIKAGPEDIPTDVIRAALFQTGKETGGQPSVVRAEIDAAGKVQGAVSYVQREGGAGMGKGDCLYIQYIGARGGGAGTRLMQDVALEANSQGIGVELIAERSLHPVTGDEYNPAGFYRRLGMTQDPNDPDRFYVPPEEMEKFLKRLHARVGDPVTPEKPTGPTPGVPPEQPVTIMLAADKAERDAAIQSVAGWEAGERRYQATAALFFDEDGPLIPGQVTTLIAYNDQGDVVGAAAYTRQNEPYRERPMMYLEHIGTSGTIPGTGTALMRDMALQAKERGTGIYLDQIDRASAEGLAAFYSGLGFHPDPDAAAHPNRWVLWPDEIDTLIANTAPPLGTDGTPPTAGPTPPTTPLPPPPTFTIRDRKSVV